jgi:hypothetical protein
MQRTAASMQQRSLTTDASVMQLPVRQLQLLVADWCLLTASYTLLSHQFQ